MENLNKKTDSVLIQMLQSKPIVLASQSPSKHAIKRTSQVDASDDDDVMILDEPRRWTKKRRLLAKFNDKKQNNSSSGGEDSDVPYGSSSSSSSSTGVPSDGEFNCECANDSGCDDEDDECEHNNVICDDHKDHKIDELCWQLEENFRENDVS
jgi:hypothetical protein